jgi:cytochrome bd-type quinol oxidase subunit 2
LNTHYAASEIQEVRTRRSARALAVLALGPLAMLAGVVWAFVQPWRITLLHPRGEGFWWLVVQPPLLVVAAGLVFALIAQGIVRDLEEVEQS